MLSFIDFLQDSLVTKIWTKFEGQHNQGYEVRNYLVTIFVIGESGGVVNPSSSASSPNVSTEGAARSTEATLPTADD